MTYSIDLRKRVVSYVENGGCKSKASEIFGVSLWCVHDWCKREDLSPKPSAPRRKRKMDWDALRQHVNDYPDAILRERASYFKVHIHAIEYAMKKMNITRKKNSSI